LRCAKTDGHLHPRKGGPTGKKKNGVVIPKAITKTQSKQRREWEGGSEVGYGHSGTNREERSRVGLKKEST